MTALDLDDHPRTDRGAPSEFKITVGRDLCMLSCRAGCRFQRSLIRGGDRWRCQRSVVAEYRFECSWWTLSKTPPACTRGERTAKATGKRDRGRPASRQAGTISSSEQHHLGMPPVLRIGGQSVECQIDCENCQMY